MPTPITPVELTISDSAQWVSVDVTAHVGAAAGNLAGVIVEVVNNSITAGDWGIQHTNCTSNIVGELEDNSHTWTGVGVDGDDAFEFYAESNTNIDLYLVGYIESGEGEFISGATALPTTLPSGSGSWENWDVSGSFSGTILCVFGFMDNTAAATRYWGVRPDGSTDNRPKEALSDDMHGFIIGAVSEIFEIYGSSASTDFYVTGVLTDNYLGQANATQFTPSGTGSYEDVDVSGTVPAGYTGALFQYAPSDTAEYSGNVKEKDGGHDTYYDLSDHAFPWVELDGNRKAEQKVENTNLELWLYGWTKVPAAGGRTTYNTRAFPLGVNVGMGFGMGRITNRG